MKVINLTFVTFEKEDGRVKMDKEREIIKFKSCTFLFHQNIIFLNKVKIK